MIITRAVPASEHVELCKHQPPQVYLTSNSLDYLKLFIISRLLRRLYITLSPAPVDLLWSMNWWREVEVRLPLASFWLKVGCGSPGERWAHCTRRSSLELLRVNSTSSLHAHVPPEGLLLNKYDSLDYCLLQPGIWNLFLNPSSLPSLIVLRLTSFYTLFQISYLAFIWYPQSMSCAQLYKIPRLRCLRVTKKMKREQASWRCRCWSRCNGHLRPKRECHFALT